MCGRYVSPAQAEIERFWAIDSSNNNPFGRHYNAAPTQTVPIICIADGKFELSLARWGLIPFWAKDLKMGYSTINARVETVATKPAFRSAFKPRRCLVPAVGYYEWKETAHRKQPYFFSHAGGELLAFGGLWETWKPQEGDPVVSYTIVVGEANPITGGFHDRMPAILERRNWERWLDRSAGTELLPPAPVELLDIYPVSKLVNSVKNEAASMIERITLPAAI